MYRYFGGRFCFFLSAFILKILSMVNEISILDNIQNEEESCKATFLLPASSFIFKI